LTPFMPGQSKRTLNIMWYLHGLTLSSFPVLQVHIANVQRA
jgi:hypothetical protein